MVVAGLAEAAIAVRVAPGSGFSWVVTGLLGVAGLFVAVVLGWFIAGEQYRRPPAALSPVERARMVREAEEYLAGLAPAVILLSEKEKAVEVALAGVQEGAARDLLHEVSVGEFWREFAVVSALVEEDPVRAIRELRRLRIRLENSISGLDSVLEALGDGSLLESRTKG